MQTDHLAKLKDLDDVNRRYLLNYIRQMRLNNVQESTISNKCWRIYVFLKFIEFRDLLTTTKQEIEDFVIHRRATSSPHTVKNDFVELKQFFKFLLPDQVDQIFTFKMQRPKNHFPVERLLTAEDVAKLVSCCTNQRDRALVSVLWDSACRIDEIMSRDVEHVTFDQYGAVVLVDGKTGSRRIRLISSVPDLQQWINQHPDGDNPKAPLFTTMRRYGKVGGERLNARTVQNMLKTLAKRAGIPADRVHPHALRHGKLTELARKGLSEGELRIQAGWSGGSSMPEVYVHLSGADVEKKILGIAGMLDEEEESRPGAMDPIRCPRCKTMNAPGARFCSQCSMALDDFAVQDMEEATSILDALTPALVEKVLERLAEERV